MLAPPSGTANRFSFLMGLRDPVVFILLLAAVFDGISDNWVHALFLGSVGIALAGDVYRRRRLNVTADLGHTASSVPAGADDAHSAGGAAGAISLAHGGAAAMGEPGVRSSSRAESSAFWTVLYASAGIAYALVVGGFPRYSWPATIAVACLGAAIIARGWAEPPARVAASSVPSRRGVIAWAAVFVAGALWELVTLLLQPTLTADSYTHPTISVLADPLLVTHTGRSLALLAWLGCGWFLVKR